MELASHATDMPRSGIRSVMDLSWGAGSDVIGLHVGEPSFSPPVHVIEAGREALASGATRYTPNAGGDQLRGALVTKLRERNGIDVDYRDVVVTAGGTQALLNAFMAVLRPGDEILLPDPGWPNFAMLARLLGADTVHYPLDARNEFVPHADSLQRLVSPQTRAIVINSPSNPLGAVYGKTVLAELIDFARRQGIWVISDECYDAITFEQAHVSPASLHGADHVISCFSMSKTYAMTGLRVGYLAAPPGHGHVFAKLQEPLVACVNASAQSAALAAVTGPQDTVDHMRSTYRERRDQACALLDTLNISYLRPSGAFYLWIDISHLTTDVANFAEEAILHRRVAIAPGTAFGPTGAGYVRVSLATETSQLLEGLQRLLTTQKKHCP